MKDLFGTNADDPVMQAKAVLLLHGYVAVPIRVIEKTLTVLAILECDAESTDEAEEFRKLSEAISAQRTVPV